MFKTTGKLQHSKTLLKEGRASCSCLKYDSATGKGVTINPAKSQVRPSCHWRQLEKSGDFTDGEA